MLIIPADCSSVSDVQSTSDSSAGNNGRHRSRVLDMGKHSPETKVAYQRQGHTWFITLVSSPDCSTVYIWPEKQAKTAGAYPGLDYGYTAGNKGACQRRGQPCLSTVWLRGRCPSDCLGQQGRQLY